MSDTSDYVRRSAVISSNIISPSLTHLFTNSLTDTLIMIDLKMILTICRFVSNNSVYVNIIFILKLSHLKCVIVR